MSYSSRRAAVHYNIMVRRAPSSASGHFCCPVAMVQAGGLSGFREHSGMEPIRKRCAMATEHKLFTLRDAAEQVLRSDRQWSGNSIGEENYNLCVRFARAFGEAMTRFVTSRDPQCIVAIDGTYWVMARDRGVRATDKIICVVGQSIAATRDHNISITLY